MAYFELPPRRMRDIYEKLKEILHLAKISRINEEVEIIRKLEALMEDVKSLGGKSDDWVIKDKKKCTECSKEYEPTHDDDGFCSDECLHLSVKKSKMRDGKKKNKRICRYCFKEYEIPSDNNDGGFCSNYCYNWNLVIEWGKY